eukprot:3305182-Rhodomonas_salina.2
MPCSNATSSESGMWSACACWSSSHASRQRGVRSQSPLPQARPRDQGLAAHSWCAPSSQRTGVPQSQSAPRPPLHAKGLELQDAEAAVRAQDLASFGFRLIVVCSRVEPVADSRACLTCSALALLCCRPVDLAHRIHARVAVCVVPCRARRRARPVSFLRGTCCECSRLACSWSGLVLRLELQSTFFDGHLLSLALHRV